MRELFVKELGLFKIIGIAWEVFKKNMLAIFLLNALIYLPLTIIFAFFPQYLVNAVVELQEFQQQYIAQGQFPLDIDSLETGVIMRTLSYHVLSWSVKLIFLPLLVGGLTYITIRSSGEKAVTFGGVLDNSLNKWGKYVLTAFLYAVILLFSSVLIIPAIIFAVSFRFYQNVVADTGKFGLNALSESFRLVKGRWFRVLMISVALYFLEYITAQLLYSVFSADNVFLVLVLTVIIQFLLSIFTIANCVWYINLKNVRKETDAGTDT